MSNEEEFAYKIYLDDDEEKEIIVPNICVDENGKEFVWELIFQGKIKYYKDFNELLAFIQRQMERIDYCSIRKMYFKHSIRFIINRKKIKKEITEEDFKYQSD